jgi:molecular chaperone DnaJ
VQIPKGIKENQKLRFVKRGHASDVYNSPPGDIIVTVKIKDHENFRRSGNDIISEVPITITQAILGGKVQIETVHGEREIELEKGITHNTRYVLKGRGASHITPTSEKFGDHIIKFRVIIPTDLSEKQVELIKNLKTIEEGNFQNLLLIHKT